MTGRAQRAIPRRLRLGIVASLAISLAAVSTGKTVASLGSMSASAVGLQFNCQPRAVLAFLLAEYLDMGRHEFRNATRALGRGDGD